jgi:hypothetical protein
MNPKVGFNAVLGRAQDNQSLLRMPPLLRAAILFSGVSKPQSGTVDF